MSNAPSPEILKFLDTLSDILEKPAVVFSEPRSTTLLGYVRDMLPGIMAGLPHDEEIEPPTPERLPVPVYRHSLYLEVMTTETYGELLDTIFDKLSFTRGVDTSRGQSVKFLEKASVLNDLLHMRYDSDDLEEKLEEILNRKVSPSP